MKELYADVILPLAVPPMTFAVPSEEMAGGVVPVVPGTRVMVGLGPRKFYSGVVLRVFSERPDFKRIRPIERVLDPERAVSAEQLRLWEWMAEYYMCPIGIVMRAAMPAKLKLGGFSPDEALGSGFKPRKVSFLRLGRKIRTEEELHEVLDSLRRARARHAAVVQYLDMAGVSGSGETYAGGDGAEGCAASNGAGAAESGGASDGENNGGRSCAAGSGFVPEAMPLIARGRILASAAVVKHLVDSGIFEIEYLEAEQGVGSRAMGAAGCGARMESAGAAGAAGAVGAVGAFVPRCAMPVLSEAQEKALAELREGFGGRKGPAGREGFEERGGDAGKGVVAGRDVALLQGVTGSGKTEIYIHLIAEALAAGNNVLYMLPEISITAQLIERMQRFFGEAVVVYHSRMTDVRRAEVYRQLLAAGGGSAGSENIEEGDGAKKRESERGKECRSRGGDSRVGCAESTGESERTGGDGSIKGGGKLIIGVRSAVLLPVPGLSLVIVDEEHDGSFKQTDNAPRYHARDTAIVLASIFGAKTVLGSATPSLESYFNAVSGKYVHVRLGERYSGIPLPRILVADTMRAARRGERVSHFTRLLLDRIDEALEAGEQVILFQNRRGYSPFIECGSCGWTGVCPDCNVTLTYHRAEGVLRCHYCGHQSPVPRVCPSCGHEDLLPRGFGTEKIEQELAAIYPEAVIDRLDADTSRAPGNYRRVIREFEQGRTDILIGTQMVTKGFDFAGVSVVGVLNADNLLNYPDFRASERAFAMMMQVGGRAGRREKQGVVVIQTSQPENPTIGQVVRGDYEAMAAAALAERRSFLYPPYCRLIAITLRHPDHDTVWNCAAALAALARPVFGRRLFGPEPPPVDRIRGQHLVRFMLKIERRSSAAEAKKILQAMLEDVWARKEFRTVEIITDVDPG